MTSSAIRTRLERPSARRMGLSLVDGPICDHDPYPRYKSGEYEVRCIEAKVYRDPRFQRFVCRLKCILLSQENQGVYGFLNVGKDKLRAGRGSKYWRAWVIANGELPRKRQVLSPRVFQGKVFLVQISDVGKRPTGPPHLDQEIYSTIREIISRRWP